jgi:hypothetical protein
MKTDLCFQVCSAHRVKHSVGDSGGEALGDSTGEEVGDTQGEGLGETLADSTGETVADFTAEGTGLDVSVGDDVRLGVDVCTIKLK